MSCRRELITLQVGQCGNQVGWRFWDILLKEHDAHSFTGFSDASSTFFSINESDSRKQYLRARAVLVDTEERVLAETQKRANQRSPLSKSTLSTSSLFDSSQFITAQSGSGNNWADGYFEYGPTKGVEALEALRKQAESCHSLQGFLMFHSVGGGTGSGLGSWISEHLAEEFGKVCKFSVSVFPGSSDDVVTSPYNSIFSLSSLANSSDSCLVVDNTALTRLAQNSIDQSNSQSKSQSNAFDVMNDHVAKAIADFTAVMRFPGSLNVDFGEIYTNLVPFPSLSFLIPSSSQLSTNQKGLFRTSDLFKSLIDRNYCLNSSVLSNRCLLASAIFGRGQSISIQDISIAARQISSKLPLAYWAEDLVKIGLCSVPPVYSSGAAFGLFNSCAITNVFDHSINRFDSLFKRRAFLNHYEKFMDISDVQIMRDNVFNISHKYLEIEKTPKPSNYRITPLL
ncbi:hypothetical protein RCL1_000559 [Eukaryota sp. TZLM3-RCL]